MADDQNQNQHNVELSVELAIAYLSNPNVRIQADDVGGVLNQMFTAVTGLTGATSAAPVEETREYTPAVSVRKSLASKDHIISMIDGKPYRTLKRHVATHGLTMDEYRERYGLKKDYPAVAPAYSEARQEMAKRIGLGRKKGDAVAPKAAAKPAPAKRTRKAPAEAKAAAQAHLGSAE